MDRSYAFPSHGPSYTRNLLRAMRRRYERHFPRTGQRALHCAARAAVVLSDRRSVRRRCHPQLSHAPDRGNAIRHVGHIRSSRFGRDSRSLRAIASASLGAKAGFPPSAGKSAARAH